MFLEPYLLAPSALTPTALHRLVTDLAADTARWRDQLRWSTAERWYAHVAGTSQYDVWLLSWTPGQGTELHDHGGSAGAFHVLTGALRETVATAAPTGTRLTERTVGAGRTVAFGPAHVHDVAHSGGRPAASLHVYSPPLRSMTYFDTAAGELRPARTVSGSGPEPAWPERVAASA